MHEGMHPRNMSTRRMHPRNMCQHFKKNMCEFIKICAIREGGPWKTKGYFAIIIFQVWYHSKEIGWSSINPPCGQIEFNQGWIHPNNPY